MILSMCFTTAKVVRQSNTTVGETTVQSSIAVSYQPKVRTAVTLVFGAKVSGSATITGTLRSSPQSEIVSISNNKIGQSIKQFDSVTNVSLSSGIVSSSTTIKIKYAGTSGSSVPIETDVVDNWPIRLTRGKSHIKTDMDGSVEMEKCSALLPYDDTWTPKEFDLITIKETNEKFMIIGHPEMEQVGINQHWTIYLSRYERS